MQHKLGAIPTPPDVRDYTIQTPRAAYPDAWEIPFPSTTTNRPAHASRKPCAGFIIWPTAGNMG